MGYFKTIYTDIQELHIQGTSLADMQKKYPFLTVNEIWEIIEETVVGPNL